MEYRHLANFDQFSFSIELGVQHRNGEILKLRPKELALLWLLIQHAGNLVTKKQIIDEVWYGFSTSDESIARCISIIKTRLKLVSPGAELLIKTEYGHGYRFVGEVTFPTVSNKSQNKKKSIFGPTTLSEIASKDLLSCSPDSTVLQAARLLKDSQKSSVLILENQAPVGIWTEADALNLDLAAPNVLDIPVCDVMSQPVITIVEDKPIADAVNLMLSKGIRHIAVVDKNGIANGIVTQSDIIYSHGVESFMKVKQVKSVAYQRPWVIRENLEISKVVNRMRLNRTDIVIIHLDQRPMFSFTEHDVINLIAENSIDLSIGMLNLPELVTVNQDTSLLVARQLMDIKKIKHLAVLDQNHNFVKILSLSDILADLEHSYVQLIEEIIERNQTASGQEVFNELLASAIKQTAGMVIITDNHGEIKYVNESFEKISQYKFNEIAGKNPRFLSSGIIPKSVFQNMWLTLMSGRTWKGELCNKKKSGATYWVLSSITPMVNDDGEIHHFIAVEEDISERKEVEARLREIEQRFYEMIDQSLIMIWESDPNGKVVYLNNYWLTFTGRKIHEETGNGWAEHLHPDDLQSYIETLQNSLIKRSAFCVDHRLKSASDEYRWVMNSGMPRFDDEGEFQGFRGTCVDITERKIREMEALNMAYSGQKQDSTL